MNFGHRSRGFTLVEMLLTVAVLAIISLLAIPSIGKTSDDQLRSAAKILIADLEYAQMQSTGDAVNAAVLVFNADGTGYSIALASDPTTPVTNPITKAPYAETFGSGRLITCPNVMISGMSVGGDEQLGFDSHGGLDQTTAATVTLSCQGRQLTITIQPYTGEASIGNFE